MSHSHVWAFTPHVCSDCFGRIMARWETVPGARRIFRCAECGAEGEPTTSREPPICACRMRFANKNAGVRCRVNPKPGPEMPSEFIAIDEGEIR